MTDFGERLRQVRENAKRTQEELARMVGQSQASISQLEKGQRHPTPVVIRKLADALEVDVAVLVGEGEGELERKMLMRNLQGLSPQSLRKINDIVELIKKGEGTP